MEAKYLWGGIVSLLVIVCVVLGVLLSAAPSQEEVDAQLSAQAGMFATQMDDLRAEFDGVKSTLESRVTEMEQTVAERDSLITELEDELQAKSDELDALLQKEEDDLAGEQQKEDGEVIDGLYLGSPVSFSIDDGDLSKLFDGRIRFNEDDFDVQEKIALDSGAFILYSAVSDEELGADPILSFNDEGIFSYRYEFDDAVDMRLISSDEPLEISFLGMPYTIVLADSNSVTLRSGEEYVLAEGTSILFNEQEVALAFVSENNKVTVCVDAVCENIDLGDSENVGGLDVFVSDILVNSRAGLATLIISDVDALRIVDDGDDLIEDVEEWKFSIDASGDMLDAFIVSYEERRDDVADEDFPAFKLGDELCLPYDFACVKFSELLYVDDYMSLDLSFDEFDEELEDGTDVEEFAVLIEVSDKSGIEVADEEVDQIYLTVDNDVYYQDGNDDWFKADSSDVKIINDDYELTVWVGGAGRVNFGLPTGDTIRLDTKIADERLGLEEGDAEADDVLYNGNSYGTREYDVLTQTGLIIEDVEANADNDEVSFKIPTDVVEAEVFVY